MANTPNPGNRIQDSMEKAKSTTSHVTQKAKDTAEKAKNVAGSLSEQVQNVARRASGIASDVGDRAGDTVSAVGGQMRTLASTIREKVPQEGVVGSAASAIANTLESGGHYLEEQKLNDIAKDLSAVIRRYPVASVLAGFGCGFLLARTLRS